VNRRGFLASCVAAIAAPTVPFSAPYYVVDELEGKWASITDSMLDPNAPLTSSLARKINATATLEFIT